MLLSNSDIYDEEWKKDLKQGKGIFNDFLGNEYNREWKNDNGKGKIK